MIARLAALVAVVAFAATPFAYAQSQPGTATKPAQNSHKPPAKKPEASKKSTGDKSKTKPAESTPATMTGDIDLAFGAYQRGYFLTAFREATKRATENNDAKAMTLLGELYS